MSTKEQQVQEMTNVIAKFIAYMAKKLPDDVEAKIKELAADEKNPLAKTIYETMHKNMDLAYELNRPSCQDTGVLQFWVKVGSNYPLIGELEEILRNATYQATQDATLRHNCVKHLMNLIQVKTLAVQHHISWDIVPGRDDENFIHGWRRLFLAICKNIDAGEGYEGVAKLY
ncbi:MAG: fumarate hydratase [Veillonella sp.]